MNLSVIILVYYTFVFIDRIVFFVHLYFVSFPADCIVKFSSFYSFIPRKLVWLRNGRGLQKTRLSLLTHLYEEKIHEGKKRQIKCIFERNVPFKPCQRYSVKAKKSLRESLAVCTARWVAFQSLLCSFKSEPKTWRISKHLLLSIHVFTYAACEGRRRVRRERKMQRLCYQKLTGTRKKRKT